MDYKKFRQAKAIEAKNKQKWLALNPKLNDESGIYILTRQDENGFRYAYVGQAKRILTRLSQHLSGYQHIDLSLKSHGLHSEDNPYGWGVCIQHCPVDRLNEEEQRWIKYCADKGYQLRNKTSGSQGEGKAKIDDYRPAKGYYDGIKQGKKSLAKELSHIAEKHLKIEIREDKKNNKVSQKQFEKLQSQLHDYFQQISRRGF